MTYKCHPCKESRYAHLDQNRETVPWVLSKLEEEPIVTTWVQDDDKGVEAISGIVPEKCADCFNNATNAKDRSWTTMIAASATWTVAMLGCGSVD